MKKPIIGITCNRRNFWARESVAMNVQATNQQYVEAIVRAGGVPLQLSMVEDMELVTAQVACCDGLLVTGGDDVLPMFYGQDAHPKLGPVYPDYDLHHLEVIRQFKESKKPILGICRGHQLLNIEAGGTLYQDIELFGEHLNHQMNTQLDVIAHKVINTDGKLKDLYGESMYVNSFHHQLINEVGAGYTVTAKSIDGVIEAIESEDGLIIGVQWHPETMLDHEVSMLKLFEDLVQKAK